MHKKKFGPKYFFAWVLLSARVSKSHGHTVMQPLKKFLTLRKILRLHAQTKNVMHFHLFYSFFFMLDSYYVNFCDIFALFLAQNFITKVLTAQ